jgi:predicted alpha-1,6-mannanase (GH76 family)
MTTIYVAMVDDRHRDPEPHLFTTAAAAIAYARERAEGWLVEDDAGDDISWLYYATHRTESDAVWVVAKELQQGNENGGEQPESHTQGEQPHPA